MKIDGMASVLASDYAAAQSGQVEVFAGALGFSRDAAVGKDLRGGDVEFMAEKPDETGEAAQLFFVGGMIVEVANEADAYAVIVVEAVFRLAVGAVFLFFPAEADLDFAITGVGAIADDEVVAEPIPAALFVPRIETLGAAFLSSAVMNDDAFPLI